NPESSFGSAVRFRMIEPLKQALSSGEETLVLAHSLGSILAWDTLWKFSRTGEYRSDFADKKVDLFLTIGCPLGDSIFQNRPFSVACTRSEVLNKNMVIALASMRFKLLDIIFQKTTSAQP
ncbi:MAG: hypothetical protein COB34_02015, partial [Methylophilaceae bacterium]